MRSSSQHVPVGFIVRATALSIGLALSTLYGTAAHAAQQYTVTDIGALAPGLNMQATGLNDSGQVIGYAYGGQYVNGTVSFPAASSGQGFVSGANGQGLTALSNVASNTWTVPNAINNAGQIVGNWGANGYTAPTHAFTTAPGGTVARDLGSLGGTSSTATGVNASGQVVGSTTTTSGAARGYITGAQGSGGMQELAAIPKAPYVTVTGINDGGKVVGYVGGTFPNENSFIAGTQPGSAPYSSISNNTPSGIYTVNVINGQDQTAGYYSQYRGAGGVVPYLRNSNGTVIVADMSHAPNYIANAPTGQSSSAMALGLNSKGQLVGSVTRNDTGALGRTYAFITDANAANLVEVSSLSFTNFTLAQDFYFTSATGINDFGSFVANGSNGHAYLITAVPEPSTGWLLLCGLLPIAKLSASRRRTHG